MVDKPSTGGEKALTDWIATGMPAKLICQQEDCHDVDLAAEGFKAGYVAALRQSAAQKEEEVKCSVFGARCKCCYPFTDADKHQYRSEDCCENCTAEPAPATPQSYEFNLAALDAAIKNFHASRKVG